MNTRYVGALPGRSRVKAETVVSSGPGDLDRDLLETAAAHPAFRIFGKAAEASGLGRMLRGVGPFTIFVPTDAAFAKLPSGRLVDLFKPENRDRLATLLKDHLVHGRRLCSVIARWEAARTMQGRAVPIDVDVEGRISVDGARVIMPDIESVNGVMHGIDRLILTIDTRYPAAGRRPERRGDR